MGVGIVFGTAVALTSMLLTDTVLGPNCSMKTKGPERTLAPSEGMLAAPGIPPTYGAKHENKTLCR